MPKGLFYIIILIVAVLANTACSTSDDPRTRPIVRNTDIVKTILPGEYIEYTVSGVLRDTQIGNNLLGSGFCAPELVVVEKQLTGTLRVSWSAAAALPEPLLGSGTIPVLQQDATLDIQNANNPFDDFGGLFAAPITHTSYISQDANNAITLHALPDPAGGSPCDGRGRGWSTSARDPPR